MGGQAPRDLPNIWKKTNQKKIKFALTLLTVAVAGTVIVAAITISYSTFMQNLASAQQTSATWWMFSVPKLKMSDEKFKAAFKEVDRKVAMSRTLFKEHKGDVGPDIDYANALYELALVDYLSGQYAEAQKAIGDANAPLATMTDDDGTNSAKNLRNKFSVLSATLVHLENPKSVPGAAACLAALSDEIATNGRKSYFFETWMQAAGQVVQAALKQSPLPKVTFRPTKKLLDQMISLCEPTKDAELLAKCLDAEALLLWHHEPVKDGNDAHREEKIRNLFQSALDEAGKLSGPNRQTIVDHIMMDLASTTSDPLEQLKLKLRVATSPTAVSER